MAINATNTVINERPSAIYEKTRSLPRKYGSTTKSTKRTTTRNASKNVIIKRNRRFLIDLFNFEFPFLDPS